MILDGAGDAAGAGGTGSVGNDPPATGGSEGASEGGAAEDAAPFTPNYKFKYAVDGQKQGEAEFDDIFKPLVRDADTEKKVRDLYAKAFGLDFVKADRDRIKAEYDPIVQNHQKVSSSLQTLGRFVQNKDYGSFFEALKIPQEDVLRYALQVIELHKMDPQQRAVYEQQRSHQQRAFALEMQNQELMQSLQQTSVRTRDTELSTALSGQGVAEAAASFDARTGKSGAFRDLVIQRGQFHALASGVDMPASQVVGEVLAMIGAQVQGGNAQGQGKTTQQAAGEKKPVLPNISGKGTSPARRIVKSTADLRKLASQMAANE